MKTEEEKIKEILDHLNNITTYITEEPETSFSNIQATMAAGKLLNYFTDKYIKLTAK